MNFDELKNTNLPPRKGGLRKINDGAQDKSQICPSTYHNPPSHIALSPGTYEYTCPHCGHTTTFSVRAVVYQAPESGGPTTPSPYIRKIGEEQSI